MFIKVVYLYTKTSEKIFNLGYFLKKPFMENMIIMKLTIIFETSIVIHQCNLFLGLNSSEMKVLNFIKIILELI